MKLIFAGTGAAFNLDSYQTNVIIQHNGKNLLVDAGMFAPLALRDIGMTYKDIDALYVTHLHADHVGGIEYLAFTTYFDPTVKNKITLIANNELTREMWTHTLMGGLKSIQGKRPILSDYFDTQMIRKNGKFYWEDIRFDIVQSVHIMDGYAIVPSFGLMITLPETGKKLYYTGDTQFNPNQIMDFYREADYIVQDCETTPYKSGVHANFTELEGLPADIKAKMILTHYKENILSELPNVSPAHLLTLVADEMKVALSEYVLKSTVINDEWNKKAKDAGFTCWDGRNYGFVLKGFELEVE